MNTLRRASAGLRLGEDRDAEFDLPVPAIFGGRVHAGEQGRVGVALDALGQALGALGPHSLRQSDRTAGMSSWVIPSPLAREARP